MPSKKTRGGGYGTFASLQATFVDENLPNVVMTATFTATGPTSAVPVPSGVNAGSILQQVTTGNPTSATVIVEGSMDGTSSWTALPAPKTSGVGTSFPFVRLNCTALTGGTSPQIIVAALAAP